MTDDEMREKILDILVTTPDAIIEPVGYIGDQAWEESARRIRKQGQADALMQLLAAEVERATGTSKVTRFEVIDHTKNLEDGGGRVIVRYGISVELSLQDDNRTLKVFIREPAALQAERLGEKKR